MCLTITSFESIQLLTNSPKGNKNAPLMYAIIETGGKQYQVQIGDQIEVEKLDSQNGSKVTFPVLFLGKDQEIKLGRPLVEGASVTGEVLIQKKAKRVIYYTYRRRKSSERKGGHRQPLTVVKITDIQGL